jgi:hypothetical protein
MSHLELQQQFYYQDYEIPMKNPFEQLDRRNLGPNDILEQLHQPWLLTFGIPLI